MYNSQLQREHIKNSTQELLDKCVIDLENKFNQMKNTIIEELTDNIRLDIIDKINCDVDELENDITYYDLPKTKNSGDIYVCYDKIVKKLESSIKLNDKEKIIVFNQRIYKDQNLKCRSKHNGSAQAYICFLCVTSFSNIYKIKQSITGRWTYNSPYKYIMPDNISVSSHRFNIQLDTFMIKIINHIGKSHRQHMILDDVHYFDRAVLQYKKMIEIYKQYYMKFLTESKIQQKYNEQVNINKQLVLKVKSLKLKTEELQNKLRDSVPLENQCCICFGYTEKKQLCVPCGHRQYCIDCIKKINVCSLCKANIDQVIKIS